MNTTSVDWQSQSVVALGRLTPDDIPAMELTYLDGLCCHLFGPEAPVRPYMIERGTVIVSLLLRSVAKAPILEVGLEPDDSDRASAPARLAVVEGAHRFASRGRHGVQQLVTRFLAPAVGELEQHAESPEAQVRSLFYYGLLAIASGPENLASDDTSRGLLAAFGASDDRIGDGFVPPWRRA